MEVAVARAHRNLPVGAQGGRRAVVGPAGKAPAPHPPWLPEEAELTGDSEARSRPIREGLVVNS
ncbi:hypothetical protein GCM10010512_45590 [Streptomyces thermoviolaceus subsp. thermoviolaceus]|nr:hypothetical protein GCM10010512_45590 [Streptomyces thermoviolaceus subsp. thermoviolaceus]